MKEKKYIDIAKDHTIDSEMYYIYKRKGNEYERVFFHSTFISMKKQYTYMVGKIEKIQNIKIPICYLTELHTAYATIEKWIGHLSKNTLPLHELLEIHENINQLVITNNKKEDDQLVYMLSEGNIICFCPVTSLKTKNLSEILFSKNDVFECFDELSEIGNLTVS